jgi:ketosteroid isomerase-like protein
VKDRPQQLKELGEDWAAAELRGDTAFLEHALADDFIAIGPRGFTLTKDQWLARHESRALRYESFRLDDARVRVYGDAAVVTGRETVKGKYEDHDLQDQFRTTLVFVKQQERWLLAGLHLSPIAGRL